MTGFAEVVAGLREVKEAIETTGKVAVLVGSGGSAGKIRFRSEY